MGGQHEPSWFQKIINSHTHTKQLPSKLVASERQRHGRSWPTNIKSIEHAWKMHPVTFHEILGACITKSQKNMVTFHLICNVFSVTGELLITAQLTNKLNSCFSLYKTPLFNQHYIVIIVAFHLGISHWANSHYVCNTRNKTREVWYTLGVAPTQYQLQMKVYRNPLPKM